MAPPIPRRYAHFVFGVIQSGLTSAIASVPFLRDGAFLGNWLKSWLLSWPLMLPIVPFAAPAIRARANASTREDI